MTSLTDGAEIRFRASNANTGAATVNVNGLTPVAIKRADGIADLDAGDISTNQDIRLRYDGSVWRLGNQINIESLGLTGQVAAFAMSASPTGWLVCDGASYPVATYPSLHAAIGYSYGGSGANFNIPDLRGEFIRGFDNGAGNDPDAAGRTNRGDGTTGDNVGTKQLSEFDSHTHVAFGDNNGTGGGGNPAFTLLAGSSGGNNKVTGSSGGNETRPRNIYMLYCIKI